MHGERVESLYVLEGGRLLTAADRDVRAAAGSWLQIPAGVPHRVSGSGPPPRGPHARVRSKNGGRVPARHHHHPPETQRPCCSDSHLRSGSCGAADEPPSAIVSAAALTCVIGLTTGRVPANLVALSLQSLRDHRHRPEPHRHTETDAAGAEKFPESLPALAARSIAIASGHGKALHLPPRAVGAIPIAGTCPSMAAPAGPGRAPPGRPSQPRDVRRRPPRPASRPRCSGMRTRIAMTCSPARSIRA